MAERDRLVQSGKTNGMQTAILQHFYIEVYEHEWGLHGQLLIETDTSYHQ